MIPADELKETRTKLLQEYNALRNRLEGLEMALCLLGWDDDNRRRAPRGNVKSALLDLLLHAGATGLNANEAVRLGAAKGIALDRNTVSSLLSRLKREGVVSHDGSKYRLQQNSALAAA